MLLIPCPWCGQRSETEFRCGGEAKPLRPDPTQCSDEQWIEYLSHGNNVRGFLDEIWCHEKGCGEWFPLRRHTVTHGFDVGSLGNSQ